MSRSPAFEPGSVFGNEYRIVRPLSEGGMGAVYVVEQISTGSLRALKVMHDHLLNDEKLRRRFVQEARVSSRIRSEHVVQVISAGIDSSSGVPWLVMELLEGLDLSSHLRSIGPLPIEKVRDICLQICHALDAAHQVGIVHRDLKPENVFLSRVHREGNPFVVKILDFGIAKILSDASSSSSTTSAIGTPLWMAPEQTDVGSEILPATDIWALGLMAFWMITGVSFWKAALAESPSAMKLMREIVFDPLPLASQRADELGAYGKIPAGFDSWFARCVCRDNHSRYPNAAEARAGLVRILGPDTSLDSGILLPDSDPRASGPDPNGTSSLDFITAKTVLASPSVLAASLPASETTSALSESIPPPSHLVAPGRGFRLPHALAAVALLALAFAVYALLRPRATLESLTRDCDDGQVGACLRLAKAHEQGLPGFIRSNPKAIQFYQKACDLDDSGSCLYLATLYQMGENLPRDDARAAHLFEKACTGGMGLACRSLGTMYMRGGPIPKSETKAAYFLTRACDLGQAEACSRAGELYRDGLGVPVEPDKAKELFAKGCFGRDPVGCKALEK